MAYTDEDKVRAEYEFLRNEEQFTGKTGTALLLKERAYNILFVKKNGTQLTVTTDFTFVGPRTITLVTPSVTGDFWEILYDTNLSSAQIVRLCTKANRFVDARIKRYDTPFDVPDPFIVEASTMLVGGSAYRTMAWKAHGEAHKQAMMIWDDGIKILGEIDDGTYDLINETENDDMKLSVGRGGEQIFSTLDEIEDVDYIEHYRQLTKADRNESSPIEL